MRTYFTLLTLIFFITAIIGQNTDIIELNKPDIKGGMPIMKALSLRASDIEFNSSELKIEDLSNLLWAANGVNRTENGKRTAPSAFNAQEFQIYVFKESGVYLYDAKKHALQLIAKDDQRKLFAKFKSKKIPSTIILLVSDTSRYPFGNHEQRLNWGALDAGMVTQNILLFCSANKLLSRPRTSMNKDNIISFLKLNDAEYPMINILIAYSSISSQ